MTRTLIIKLMLLTGIGILGYWYLALNKPQTDLPLAAHASEVFPDMRLRPNPDDGKPLSWTPDHDSFPRGIRQLSRQQQIEALRIGR